MIRETISYINLLTSSILLLKLEQPGSEKWRKREFCVHDELDRSHGNFSGGESGCGALLLFC